ncbi:hypothetical protein BHE74_00037558, partial [Ensete ventricosum]
ATASSLILAADADRTWSLIVSLTPFTTNSSVSQLHFSTHMPSPLSAAIPAVPPAMANKTTDSSVLQDLLLVLYRCHTASLPPAPAPIYMHLPAFYHSHLPPLFPPLLSIDIDNNRKSHQRYPSFVIVIALCQQDCNLAIPLERASVVVPRPADHRRILVTLLPVAPSMLPSLPLSTGNDNNSSNHILNRTIPSTIATARMVARATRIKDLDAP